MPQFFIDLPLAARLLILGVAGALGGTLANHVIYTWCWFPRPISPWRRLENPKASETSGAKIRPKAVRRWSARIPVLGWLLRRRRDHHLGALFWLRPLCIEVALIVALPAYYWFTCESGGLLPPTQRHVAAVAALSPLLHWVFLAHAILLVLMTAATFIDFDEQTIPDAITVPGTLIALGLATLSPKIFLPVVVRGDDGGMLGFRPVTFSLPDLPADPKWATTTGLIVALAIWSAWCFALLNRRVILRKGLTKAVQFFFAGLVRYPSWKFVAVIWLLGVSGVAIIWTLGGNAWTGLFTSLCGLAVGGGVVWAVRIVASTAMGIEAMGFGDVTLMAMIGAFIGWQASLAAFFLSPIAAIAIVITQYIITRESRVPFGPYLCAGTALTAIFWDPIYNGYLESTLRVLGPVLLWFGVAMFAMLGGMLFVWGLIKRSVFA